MTKIRQAVRNFVSNDDGAALVEYAVLLVLVAIACIVAAAFLGKKISTMFQTAGNQVSGL